MLKFILIILSFTILNATEWEIKDNTYFTNAKSHSSDIFGFNVLHGKKCDLEILYLTFNTINMDIKKHEGESVHLNFVVDKKITFQINASFHVSLFPKYRVAIVIFDSFIFNHATMELFLNSKEVQISIDKNQKISKYFDIKHEVYILNHMQEARQAIVKNECKLKL